MMQRKNSPPRKRNRRKTIILEQQESFLKKIKVRLNAKTTIIINRISSFSVWKELYPEAKIIA